MSINKVHDQTASPHWARRGARAQAPLPLGYKSPSYATLSLQLTSRIFGNMMADCIAVVRTNIMDRLLLKPPVPPYNVFFLICASGRAASRPAGALSEYWLRPFPFSGGLHAGILLLAYLNNQSSNSWAAPFK